MSRGAGQRHVAKPEIVASDTVTPLSAALEQLYFDTVLHDATALGFPIDRVGADRVLFGTDYPLAMGDPHLVATVETVNRLAEGDGAAFLRQRRATVRWSAVTRPTPLQSIAS